MLDHTSKDQPSSSEEVFVEGQWVEAVTVDRHHVFGYVYMVDADDKTAMVNVVRSLCCRKVTEKAWARWDGMRAVAENKLSDVEGYLLNAIDFALDTKSQAYFMELTTALRKLKGLPVVPSKVVVVIRLN